MSRRRVVFAVTVLLVLIATTPALLAESVGDFVRRHWRHPIPAQGPPPPRYSAIEASLQPDACGSCHPSQYAAWRQSGHAAAMGPGVAGQLVEMTHTDPATAIGCYRCHAPLAEQLPLRRGPAELEPNPAFDAELRHKGIACAGCHVRAHERFGPPTRDGSLVSASPRETLPHGGATRSAAFLRSEFCESCHQFAANGPALNGKLLQNTYNEWKASRFARQGVQCQDCHMPDRRHEWRGIHDADMVRSGLTITAAAGGRRYRPGELVSATLTVVSTRIGHAFPTYVTPRVVLRVELFDAAGNVLPGSQEERVIGREVELDLSREISDTRLAPGARAVLAYRRRVDREGVRARFSVTVEPDAFYTRFFEVLLRQGAGRGEAEIREALDAARRSPYVVFEREIPVS